MKLIPTISLIVALTVAGAAFAQTSGASGSSMNDKDTKGCMAMKGMKDMDMKGTPMKDADAQKCKDMMSGADMKPAKAAGAVAATAETDATVNGVDVAHSKVTLSHGPIANFGWPAMTMGFTVKDKALFDMLAVGKKVHVELRKDGAEYVVTSVK